ncbi:MAG: helix-turn-helix transcriptional regulator [Saprospiraceae bacterium]|nr:helix-turn-helix transcriptional regulator [Saprospiraceae bacterium]
MKKPKVTPKSHSAKNNDYEAVLSAIAANVRRLRKDKGWSQEDLANFAEIDRTYVGYVENAKNNVSLRTLCKIARAFDLDVQELL